MFKLLFPIIALTVVGCASTPTNHPHHQRVKAETWGFETMSCDHGAETSHDEHFIACKE